MPASVLCVISHEKIYINVNGIQTIKLSVGGGETMNLNFDRVCCAYYVSEYNVMNECPLQAIS